MPSVRIGDEEEDDGTLFFTWSHTNSSSDTSSRASGEGEAYLCMVLMRVEMYFRFASVRERLDCAFHESLYLQLAIEVHSHIFS